MSDETFNGWTNRETWALMLWINNDQGLQDEAHELVELAEPQGLEHTESAFRNWAETLLSRHLFEDEFGTQWPPGLADMAEDIGSLWRVNWSEATAALLEDVSELTA